MTFKEIIPSLFKGHPVKHGIHGRVFRVSSTESFFLHVGPKEYKKVVCTDLYLLCMQPINSDKYILMSKSVQDGLNDTDGWEFI